MLSQCVGVLVRACLCVFFCVDVSWHRWEQACVRLYVCVCVCVCVCMCANASTSGDRPVSMCVCVCLHACVYLCGCVVLAPLGTGLCVCVERGDMGGFCHTQRRLLHS